MKKHKTIDRWKTVMYVKCSIPFALLVPVDILAFLNTLKIIFEASPLLCCPYTLLMTYLKLLTHPHSHKIIPWQANIWYNTDCWSTYCSYFFLYGPVCLVSVALRSSARLISKYSNNSSLITDFLFLVHCEFDRGNLSYQS